MDLFYRSTQISDLPFCLPLARNRCAFGEGTHASLLAMWTYLLKNRMAISAVVVDRDRDQESRIVGFGMSTFTTDEFVELSASELPPYGAFNIFERWQRGPENLPLLTFDEIKKANSGCGLNISVLHRGWERAEQGLTSEEYLIGPKLYESFMALHRGYRLKRIQVEVYGDSDRDRLAGFGFNCVTDFSVYFAKTGSCQPPSSHPYLMEAASAQILQRPYHSTTALFITPCPKIYFTHGEQLVLAHALEGHTDTEISLLEDITISAVHKRWRTIFGRVIGAQISIFPPTLDSVRGQEKRHTLLRYLREHPEELRPYNRPKSNVKC